MNQTTTISNGATVDASAADYLEHASRINALARTLLRLESRDADWLSGKISLGLSLQAAELAGKGMLRALGHSVKDIHKRHGGHKLLPLLQDVESELQNRPEAELSRHHHFLLRTPIIDGTQYGTTIGKYLSEHFAEGPSARPRNYFYPDFPAFTGPVPIHALFVMVEDIIAVSQEVITLVAGAKEE